jgi:hypothetical protein
MNIIIQQNSSVNESKIEELISEYTKDRQFWEKERQELINKCNSLDYLISELKAKITKMESNKENFIEGLKKQISIQIDDRFREKYQI